MTQNLPPQNNELEISVFGPGVGECILVHFGNQKWIVVDSCIDPITNEPLPLRYLKKLGLTPKNAIKIIVSTHWHDDHSSGLSDMINQCEESKFVCSDAVNSIEFLKLMYWYENGSSLPITGVREISKVFHILKTKDRIPTFAKENLLLYENDKKEAIKCKIISLSPSDKSVLLSKLEISKLIPQTRILRKPILPQPPNNQCVVLWIDFQKERVLLGADLENINDSKRGWLAILKSDQLQREKALIFKIPHHGSNNADHPEIWNSLVKKNPFAILTPYSRLRDPLPTKTDINRILSKTTEAYLTANPTRRRKIKRSNTVEKILKESGCKIYREISSIGQVRLRGRVNKNKIQWNVDLFDDAFKLNQNMT